MITENAVSTLERNGLPVATAERLFNTPRTYLIDNSKTAIQAQLPLATLLETFTRYTDLAAAVAGGSIPSSVHVLVYDNEGWTFTPPNEQQQPFVYASQAEQLAHAHDDLLLFTPAVNLAPILSPSVYQASGHDKYAAYLSLGIARQGAQVSDIFEIQSQQAEGTPEFDSFVAAAVGQARQSQPKGMVLVGIGTEPGGRPVSLADIEAAYDATRSEVDGYWFNIAANSPKCPNCGTGQPGIGVQFFEQVAQSSS